MKRILAILVLASFLFGAAVPAYAKGTFLSKEEVVYGILSHDGSVQSVYVVNSFDGGGSITDYGDYSEVRNMTSAEPISQKGDAVTLQTTSDRFYYQGTLKSKELPWNISIRYSLDGQAVSPQELAGRSGTLSIEICVGKNPAVNPVFYENYMLQFTLTLDSQKCSNIRSENATIASAGRNKVIAYTALPGKDVRISVSADVRDFSMNAIEITGMPFSMSVDMPDTENLTKDLSLLSDAVSELNDGVLKLSDGISKTYSGTKKLADGSSDFADGLNQLSEKSAELVSASSQIEKALSTVASSLSGKNSEGFSVTGMDALPDALRQLAGGLSQVTSALESLIEAFTAAYSALDKAIAAIPDTVVDTKPLYAAVFGNKALTDAVDALVAHYAAAKTVKGTYVTTKEAFAAMEGGLTTVSGSVNEISASLSQMADGIEQALSSSDAFAQLRQLKDGLTELSSQYSRFHAGLAAYSDGVQTLSSGYGKVHAGVQSLRGGIGQLDAGARELAGGTGELREAVSDLPVQMQEKIDALMEDYDRSDYLPVSFVSAKNTNVSAVQFVLKTRPIEPAETEEAVIAAPEKLTFWQKLLRLFGLY